MARGLVLSRLRSGLFRAMLAMKRPERNRGKTTPRRPEPGCRGDVEPGRALGAEAHPGVDAERGFCRTSEISERVPARFRAHVPPDGREISQISRCPIVSKWGV